MKYQICNDWHTQLVVGNPVLQANLQNMVFFNQISDVQVGIHLLSFDQSVKIVVCKCHPLHGCMLCFWDEFSLVC